MRQSLLFTISLCLFMQPLAAHQTNSAIESASQFQQLCKQQSHRYFKKKKLVPYNWSASTIRRLNNYETRGNWRVQRKVRRVRCSIRVGKRAKSLKMKIE